MHCCEQVVAIPGYFDGKNIKDAGCTVPKKGYERHGEPVVNEQVTFQLSHPEGGLVTAWHAGKVYHLTTSQDTGQEMQAVVVASIGTLNITHEEEPSAFPKTVGFQTKSCENAWGSDMPRLSHTMRWDPPAEVPAAGLCVGFSAAQASTKRSAYQVNTVRLHMVSKYTCRCYRGQRTAVPIEPVVLTPLAYAFASSRNTTACRAPG